MDNQKIINLFMKIDGGYNPTTQELDMLKGIERLSFKACLINALPEVIGELTQLKELDLSYTQIKYLPESICELTNLEILNLRFTNIQRLPENIGDLEKLIILDLSRTKIEYLPTSIENLKNLEVLDLGNTPIKMLPFNIDKLISLKILSLCFVHLDGLPREILDLSLNFIDDEYPLPGQLSSPNGIYIRGIGVMNVPTDILLADPLLLREYLESSNENEPINECKVMFLGDGGAGKSLIIHRLMNDGIITEDFSKDATPGINICSKKYQVGKEVIDLHFWDFGGQDIMYSMHRMFLTNRSLYIVVVNVRDNRQTEQAKFWIRNIRSFAKDVPILIIATHTDENEYAKVRITRIREEYDNIVDVLYISALKSDPETFLGAVRKKLIDTIMTMKTPRTALPVRWKQLINHIRTMPENYITSDYFYAKCLDYGISTRDDIMDSLIAWYQDLGVCFYSRRHPTSKKYMVLKPFWMLNALYILIVNGRGCAKNGFINENDIYKLIQMSEKDKEIKCVTNKIKYEDDEIQYIINVVLNFDLMYRVDNNRFFVPMLCDEYEDDLLKSFRNNNTAHIYFKYSYLPENVLHRYMVRMGSEIRPEFAWRTAAVFDRERCGWESFIRSEEDMLDIYVNANKHETHPVNTYLEIIRDSIYRINTELGLEAEEFVTYRRGDYKEVAFKLKFLLGCLKNGIGKVYSSDFDDAIYINEILSVVQNSNNELVIDVIRQMSSILLEMTERCVDLKKRGEVELTADFQLAISPVLNQKHGIQVVREYTIGRAKKRIGETDLLFYRYKDGIKQFLFILENKDISGFIRQYEQLMGYLNPNFLAGITLSINRNNGWEESFDYICDKLESLKKENHVFAPVDIDRKIVDRKTQYVKSQHIVPETGKSMPVYHLVLNISDKDRQEIALRSRSKRTDNLAY